MKQDIITTAAEQLETAERSRITCTPVRELIAHDDIDSAYKIQATNISKKVKNGAKVLGYKIGLTSKAVQKQLGVDQPDFGVLLDSMLIDSNEFSFEQLMQPKSEAEIAFILKHDITDQNISLEQLRECIDYAQSSIEIVGSRIEGWNIKIADTIADNASASHFILGKNKVNLDDLDLENCKMTHKKNGEISSEGSGAACLGNPLNAAQWLAQTMVKNGNALKKGDILLTGALGPMTGVEKGDTIEASIEGFDTITINFI